MKRATKKKYDRKILIALSARSFHLSVSHYFYSLHLSGSGSVSECVDPINIVFFVHAIYHFDQCKDDGIKIEIICLRIFVCEENALSIISCNKRYLFKEKSTKWDLLKWKGFWPKEEKIIIYWNRTRKVRVTLRMARDSSENSHNV